VNPSELDADEQQALIKLARLTVEKFVQTGERINPISQSLKITKKMKENKGVFVTLKKHGNLRGCIGYITGIKPLIEAIVDNAVNAASSDPRFQPVTPNELNDISIEISVMSPLAPIKPEDVQIGVHGLVLEKGFSRGVFLPQVPVEQGWNREEYLDNLCNKAGLSFGCWPSAKLQGFTAQVFGENK
jgi:AmmeMemoRadiSam system protein A